MRATNFVWLIAFLVLFIAPMVSASFLAVPLRVELKSELDNDWSNRIRAAPSDTVDVRLIVFVDDTANDPRSTTNVSAYAKIWGLRPAGNWELIRDTITQNVSARIEEETTIVWENAFSISSIYEQYRVEVFARSGSQAFEDFVTGYVNPIVQSPSCGDMVFTLLPDSVTFDEQETITETFSLENRSDRTFFIDAVEATENSPSVIVTVDRFDSAISPHQEGLIRLKLESRSVSNTVRSTGFIRVRGHFSSTSYCSSSQIETKSFSIVIRDSGDFTGGSDNRSCSAIKIDAPVAWPVNGSAAISFTVDNPTNQRLFVNLRGADLTVSPNAFSVSPNSTQSFSANVQYYFSGSTKLEFWPIGERCQGFIKYTTIYSSAVPPDGSFQPPFDDALEIVSAPAQVVLADRTTIMVSVRNNSNRFRIIETKLEGFPSEWFTDSLTMGFQPNETKTLFLDVMTNNVQGRFAGMLVVQSDGVQTSKALTMIASTTVGFGSDVSVTKNVTVVSPNEVVIEVSLRNNSVQQLRGTGSLQNPNGSILEQQSFVLNPSVNQRLSFNLRSTAAAPAPSSVILVLTLDDGRSQVETIALPAPGTDALSPWAGLNSWLISLGGDDWTLPLLIILVLVLLVVLFSRKSSEPTQSYKAIRRERLVIPPTKVVTVPTVEETQTKVMETKTEETRVKPASELAPAPRVNGKPSERFWFLKEFPE